MSNHDNLPDTTADNPARTNVPAPQPAWGQPPGQGPILSSFDVSTPEGRMGVFEALQGETQKASDWLNVEMDVVHVVCHPVEFEAEGGEMVKAMRTVLVTVGGERIGFVAESIYKAVHMIAFAFGAPPWPKGLKLRLSQEELGGGKRWYKLTPIIQAKKRGQHGQVGL